jgi:hypothetical protein
MIFYETAAAFGAEDKIQGHLLLAVGTGGLEDRRRGRLRGILERVLILSGHLRSGLADFSDELSQGFGILGQFLRPKENKGQDGEDDEFLERDSEHAGTPAQALVMRWPQWGQKFTSPA